MSRQPVSVGGRADATEVRQELLGRLGLKENASDQEVEAAHNGLVDFLELAPHEVKFWATAKTTDVDEAFALLSGPERDLVLPVVVTTEDALDEKPPTSTVPAPRAYTARSAAPLPAASLRRWPPTRTQLMWAILPLLVVAIVFGVYWSGKDSVPGISGTPTNATPTASSSSPTAAPLDQAKVGALMQKITANPKDKVSLAALGEVYFTAADYKNASVWEQKVLALDPKNQEALLALGASQFNIGNKAEAKKQWLIAEGLYPKNVEVHYDLGFYYMSQKPAETANMKLEWGKVVALDPNSALAKSVQTVVTGTKPTASATSSAK